MVSHPSHAMSVVSVARDPNGSNDLKIKCSDFLDRNVFSTPGTLSNWAWKRSEKTSLANWTSTSTWVRRTLHMLLLVSTRVYQACGPQNQPIAKVATFAVAKYQSEPNLPLIQSEQAR